ncbi:sulfite exporter TauE/SafE family protein [Microbacter sp. GSS18]|nr:sulfite exporter TauE/SafE family protein [Microbacter sp. GSS18]
MDWGLTIAALGIGVVVGLTGMGGGALMTPVLVLFFGIPPLTAVSSDLITSAAMKPVGSIVHMRRGTVHWRIVLWLVVGSVPAAFSGALIISAIGPIAGVNAFVKTALGVVLIVAAVGLVARAYLQLVERQRIARGEIAPRGEAESDVRVRVVPTVIVGVVGGLMVGLTSVGSGSLIIVALMALYPVLSANRLVGTDLVQAVPLVIAAAAGHLLYGDVDWAVVWPLIIGSVPGAFLGAQLSSRISGGIVRRALAIVLVVAGLKLLGVSNTWTLVAAVATLVLGTVAWAFARRRHGLRATHRAELRMRASQSAGD